MPSIDRQQHWHGVYESKADEDVSWYQPEPAPSLEMIDRCALPVGARVIDIGGGSSRLVDALLDRGFKPTVLDISSLALERARQRLGDRARDVKWIAADVTMWQPNETYDLWHDRAAFHFLTDSADRAAYRQALRNTLNPGGFVIIAAFAPDGPDRCSGLPVQRFDPASLASELGSGFDLLDSFDHAHHTPWSAVQQFQFSRFSRA